MIDVPVQVVDSPSVQSHVYVLPSANWDLGQPRGAHPFVLKDDPEDYQTLDWEDVPETAVPDASAATSSLGPDRKSAVKHTLKKRAVIHKHGKPPKKSGHPLSKKKTPAC